MFEALVITLREGVEAALVLAIASGLLRRRELQRLIPALLAGAFAALLASAGLAALATRLTYNEELAEGIAMLVGTAMVLTLVWWMWRSAPRMKQEIEHGLVRASGGWLGGAGGVFLFGFGMVLREGFETAIFLSAAEFNSSGLLLWVGALAGLALATVFGVLFARGAFKVPLRPFFSLTSAVLLLFAFQLLVGGLHELSEGQFLPSSRSEMALIVPLVKNELLLFTLTVALALVWLLREGASRGPAEAAPPAAGAEGRLERANRAGEALRRRWTAALGALVVLLLAVAFARQSNVPGKAPAQPLALVDDEVAVARSALADHRMHYFEVAMPQGAAARFFAIQVGDEVKTCFDACEICGDKGYYLGAGAAICRNCTSPIPLGSLGRTGGCNPIPLPHRSDGALIRIRARDLTAVLPHLKGR